MSVSLVADEYEDENSELDLQDDINDDASLTSFAAPMNLPEKSARLGNLLPINSAANPELAEALDLVNPVPRARTNIQLAAVTSNAAGGATAGPLSLLTNPTYEELFAPEFGPVNPHKSERQRAQKNMLSGYVAPLYVSEFGFETQRRTFRSFGHAEDPSVQGGAAKRIQHCQHNKKTESKVEENEEDEKEASGDDDADTTTESSGVQKTVFESQSRAALKRTKRKRAKCDDPSDVDGYLGPWAKFEDEELVSKPSAEDKPYLDEYLAKMAKRKRNPGEPVAVEETTQLHINSATRNRSKTKRKEQDEEEEEMEREENADKGDKNDGNGDAGKAGEDNNSGFTDYQGRSLLSPHNLVNSGGAFLRIDGDAPENCALPARQVKVYKAAHSGRSVSTVRLLPNGAGHLMLSAGMDSQVKIWELYGERRLLRSYHGHREAVRDICFSLVPGGAAAGRHFLSASYDRHIKLWDTESGACVARFAGKRMSYCVRFHPERADLFIAGTQDKKILCYDVRSGEVVQVYDRHLGAVNAVQFIEEGRRFVSTSDDKSLRMWEWDIPVDFRALNDPSMHSMPAMTLSDNGKWLACQSLDNQIVTFNVMANFKKVKKKTFRGHMVSGYACEMAFSPDNHFLISGDGDGRLFAWDFKRNRQVARWQAHSKVCSSVAWLPQEKSKFVTAGWDGDIKLWN